MITHTPDTINGYPVCAVQMHATCATVQLIRDPENAPDHSDIVVATWWPDLGDTWSWGHYFKGPDAQEKSQTEFHIIAARNARR